MENTSEAVIGKTVAGNKDCAIKRQVFINIFARFTQFITWPFVFLLSHLLFNLSIHGRENFKKISSPFILISNHISFYDSFLFRLALGFWTPHLPLRFMAVTKFNWRYLNFLEAIGIVDLIYTLFGVFIVVPGLGADRNLRVARNIIRAGGNVVIYPEGKIFLGDGGIGEFKKGAAILALETRVPIIPVAFSMKYRWFRRRIDVRIGAPMDIISSQTVENVTRSFYKRIKDLYEIK